MNNTNLKILDLINLNLNLKEIASILNLSEKQLYIRIKQLINYRYVLEPSYTYNSDIYYKIKTENTIIDKNNVSINLPKDIKTFKCLVISDLHIGDIDSNIKLVNIVYDYAVKNGINVILNCGDNIEGDYTSGKKSIEEIHNQLEFYVKKYPYDKNINNFTIFGNHDHHSFSYNGLDVSKMKSNYRYDIILVGYGQGVIKIKKR